MVRIVKAHTTGKTNNIAKSLFTVPTIKKLSPQINQIEDKKGHIIKTWSSLNS